MLERDNESRKDNNAREEKIRGGNGVNKEEGGDDACGDKPYPGALVLGIFREGPGKMIGGSGHRSDNKRDD